MRDYAELIKTLRYCNEYDNCGSRCPRFESNGDGDCVDGLMKDAADAIEELLAELTTIRKQLPRWTSVEDELPNKPDLYLCVVKSIVWKSERYERVLRFEHGHFFERTFFNGNDENENVTHWMPLPEPPKGVE